MLPLLILLMTKMKTPRLQPLQRSLPTVIPTPVRDSESESQHTQALAAADGSWDAANVVSKDRFVPCERIRPRIV